MHDVRANSFGRRRFDRMRVIGHTDRSRKEKRGGGTVA